MSQHRHSQAGLRPVTTLLRVNEFLQSAPPAPLPPGEAAAQQHAATPQLTLRDQGPIHFTPPGTSLRDSNLFPNEATLISCVPQISSQPQGLEAVAGRFGGAGALRLPGNVTSKPWMHTGKLMGLLSTASPVVQV